MDAASRETISRIEAEGVATIGALASAFWRSEERTEPTRSAAVAVDLGGYSVLVDPQAGDGDRAILERRDDRPHLRRRLARCFHPGETFVDVGAGIGGLALLEPDAGRFQRLCGAVVFNEFTTVRVLNQAASDCDEILALGGASFAQAAALDGTLQQLSRLDVLHVSVGGREAAVLRGAAGLIERHTPMIVASYAPVLAAELGCDPSAVAEFILSRYGRLTAVAESGDEIEFGSPRELFAHWKRLDVEHGAAKGFSGPGPRLDLIAARR